MYGFLRFFVLGGARACVVCVFVSFSMQVHASFGLFVSGSGPDFFYMYIYVCFYVHYIAPMRHFSFIISPLFCVRAIASHSHFIIFCPLAPVLDAFSYSTCTLVSAYIYILVHYVYMLCILFLVTLAHVVVCIRRPVLLVSLTFSPPRWRIAGTAAPAAVV